MQFPDKSGGTPPPATKKKIEPVISSAKEADRPATRRFMDNVFAETPRNLTGRIVQDVIVPTLKRGFEEAVNGFVSGMLWGTGGKPLNQMVKGTVLGGGGQTVHYAGISNNPAMAAARHANVPSSNGGNYRDILCATRRDAETLLASMYGLLNEYRVVAVADLYELANMDSQISDNSFGWTTLDGARITPQSGGFVLQLPRPSLI